MVNSLFICLFWTNIFGIKFFFRLSPCNQKYENNNILIFYSTILILAADNMLLFPGCPIAYIPLCMSPSAFKLKYKRLTHTCHAKQWPTPPSILNMPDETLTMHLLWQTLAISNCSVYVKSCNSTGLSPIQRPFARARVGILFLSETLHI